MKTGYGTKRDPPGIGEGPEQSIDLMKPEIKEREKGGVEMKERRLIQKVFAMLPGLILATLTMFAFALSQEAQAATSGGATIYNTVKVTYQSGTGPVLFAAANVSVTVATVPTAPTVTNPSGLAVIAGGTATYNYIVKSNSNGLDTYTTSALTNTPTGVTAASAPSVTANVQLWGGIALGSPANDTITVQIGRA